MSAAHRGILVLSPRLKVSDADLAALREAGYVPLVGNPAHVKLLAPVGEMDGNALTLAAFKTCNENEQRRQQFGALVLKSLIIQAGAEVKP